MAAHPTQQSTQPTLMELPGRHQVSQLDGSTLTLTGLDPLIHFTVDRHFCFLPNSFSLGFADRHGASYLAATQPRPPGLPHASPLVSLSQCCCACGWCSGLHTQRDRAPVAPRRELGHLCAAWQQVVEGSPEGWEQPWLWGLALASQLFCQETQVQTTHHLPG